MNKDLKKLSKNIYLLPFFCGFLYFVVIFIKVPVIGDRWMESWTYYDLQDIWRGLFTQAMWMQRANTRVFSNLFSMLFDKNIYQSSIECFYADGFLSSESTWFQRIPGKGLA